jgi:hypothetical protein
LRNLDFILTIYQETRGEILFHRKIRNRDLDEQRKLLSKNSDTQYHEIPRRLVSHPSQRTGGSGSTHHRHFGIWGFNLSKKLDIATHEIVIHEIAIRSQLFISPGHVANIVAPIDISEFGVSSCQRNLTSQLTKSRYTKSRSDLSRPYLLDTWQTLRVPSAYRHSKFQVDINSEHRKSRYPKEESGSSITLGRVA